MKRACSLNTVKDGYFTCEFHPANKNKLYTDEKGIILNRRLYGRLRNNGSVSDARNGRV